MFLDHLEIFYILHLISENCTKTTWTCQGSGTLVLMLVRYNYPAGLGQVMRTMTMPQWKIKESLPFTAGFSDYEEY